MKRFAPWLLVVLAPLLAHAQQIGDLPTLTPATPSGNERIPVMVCSSQSPCTGGPVWNMTTEQLLQWLGSVGAINGDCTVNTTTSVITCTKTAGVPYAPSATTDTTNASNITSGTLNADRLPATINANTTGNAATASSAAALSGTVPAAQVTGLAPSATTDTTNATNITSGTLPAGRIPASGVVAGSCTNCNLSYGADGRITVAANGSGGGGGPTVVTKTTDTARTSSASATPDPALQFAKGAGTFSFDCFIYSTNAASTNSLLFDISTTGTVTAGNWFVTGASDTGHNLSAGISGPINTPSNIANCPLSGSFCGLKVSAVVTQSTSGTISFAWGQSVSSGSAMTVKAGSWCMETL